MPLFIERILFNFGGNHVRISLARKWGMKVGKNCIINPPLIVPKPYLVSIGNDCVITSGVSFLTGDAGMWIFRKCNKKEYDKIGSIYGPIIIHDNCFIGLNSIILPNIVIGPNSIVGAGSVVTKMSHPIQFMPEIRLN